MTGVQTCALPISSGHHPAARVGQVSRHTLTGPCPGRLLVTALPVVLPHRRASGYQARPHPSLPTGLGAPAPAPVPRGGSLPHAPAPGGGARRRLLGSRLCHRPREPRRARTPRPLPPPHLHSAAPALPLRAVGASLRLFPAAAPRTSDSSPRRARRRRPAPWSRPWAASAAAPRAQNVGKREGWKREKVRERERERCTVSS